MEKIQVQIENGKPSRGLFARPLVLVTLSAVLVTGVLAILFETNQSNIEFGQSATQVQSCAYVNGNYVTITPSSSYVSGDYDSAVFNLTGLNMTFDNTGCAGDVLAVTFVNPDGTLLAVDGSLTTIEIKDGVNPSSAAALGDLVSANDVEFCATDGSSCVAASSHNITVTNSSGGQIVKVGLANLNPTVDAGSVKHVVLQTYGGFTS